MLESSRVTNNARGGSLQIVVSQSMLVEPYSELSSGINRWVPTRALLFWAPTCTRGPTPRRMCLRETKLATSNTSSHQPIQSASATHLEHTAPDLD